MKRILAIITMLAVAFAAGCTKETEVVLEDVTVDDPHDVSILFVNVNRADASIVKIDGKSYVIDTGTEEDAYRLLAALEYMGIDELDGVFLTHTHEDHIGGLEAVAAKYDDFELYAARISKINKDGTNDIDLLAEKIGKSVNRLIADDIIEIADGVYFEVIGPLVYDEDEDNENSMVLLLSVNGRKVLFTGDMQFAEEASLMDAGLDLDCDILKVGNHGNPDATSAEFAAAASPAYSVIPTDTAADRNSANIRVTGELSKYGKVLLTQDFNVGALFGIDENGGVSYSDVEKLSCDSSAEITFASKTTQATGIISDKDEDISGFFIVSSKGYETYVFPEGSKLSANTPFTLECSEETWNRSRVYAKKADDYAVLYDRYGNEVSRCLSE